MKKIKSILCAAVLCYSIISIVTVSASVEANAYNPPTDISWFNLDPIFDIVTEEG